MSDWAEHARLAEWHRIDVSRVPDDELGALFGMLADLVPMRTYGEGLSTYEDHIHRFHAKTWHDYYAADLLHQVRERLELLCAITRDCGSSSEENRTIETVYKIVRWEFRNAGFWIPDVPNYRPTERDFYAYISEEGRPVHVPTPLAVDLKQTIAAYSGAAIRTPPTVAQEMMADPRMNDAFWARCVEELKIFRAGMPEPTEDMTENEEKWRSYIGYVEGWASEEVWRRCQTMNYLSRTDALEPFTRLRLAADMLHWAEQYEHSLVEIGWNTRRLRARGSVFSDAESIFETGYAIGRAAELLRLKEFEPLVLKWAQQRRYAAQGGAARASETRARTAEIIWRMEQLTAGGQTDSGAARICAAQGIGTSRGANLRAWGRHKSKIKS